MNALPQDHPLHVAMIGSRGLPNLDGGVERAVEALSRELVALGQRVTVYGRLPYCARDPREFAGVRQIPLRCVRTKHLETLSYTALATAHALSTRRYDLIHYHAVGPAMLSFLPRLTRTPVVATVHALDYQREKWGALASGALRLGTWMAASVPNQTIAVSQTLADQLQSDYGRRVHHIPNGVDLPDAPEETVPELEGRRFALFLGRLVPEKGVHTLIRAFSATDTDAALAIVGDASHTAGYVEELKELAAGDERIEFLGSRAGGQKLWLLRHSAAFVQPSTLEGMPIALLEAIACGAPLIVSDLPAHREAIAPMAESVSVFPPGDADALRSALAGTLSNRAEPSARSQPIALSGHDWKQIARETLGVYRDAVGSPGDALR